MASTKCDHCDKENAIKRCSKCRLVFYCSRDCQVAGWKGGHKKTCSPWATLSCIPSGGGKFVAATGVYGDCLIVVRGMDGPNGQAQKGECWSYHLPTKEWSKRKNVPVAFRTNANGLAVQQHLYLFLFAGTELRTFRMDMSKSNSKWEEKSPLIGMRMDIALATDNQRYIYVSGGKRLMDPSNPMSPQIPLASIARYDVSNNTWDPQWSTMPTPRYCHSSVLIKNNLYIVGGRNEQFEMTGMTDNKNDPTRRMPICNVNTNTWDEGLAVPSVSADSCAAAWQDNFLVTFSSISKVAFVLDIGKQKWAVTATHAMLPLRVQPRAVVMPDGKLALVGGMNPFAGAWFDEIKAVDLDALVQSARSE